VASIGKAWAVVRGRLTGDREKAKGLLDQTPTAKLIEMNRQESQARGSRRKRTPYRLGERVR